MTYSVSDMYIIRSEHCLLACVISCLVSSLQPMQDLSLSVCFAMSVDLLHLKQL